MHSLSEEVGSELEKERKDLVKLKALANRIATLEYDLKLESAKAKKRFMFVLERLMRAVADLSSDF